MKWPDFLKFKLPKWKWDFKIPTFFKPSLSFFGAWKKFVRQIPPESRSILKSYQHFIVLGAPKSGKSDLIRGLIDQSQDLYPFDTTYTEIPDIQFYIGPRQVIEEIAFSTLEDRSIRARKQIIRLWKKLYAKNPPLVVVAYDCGSGPIEDLKEFNRLAQLIAGKASLLSEISKRQIKLRIALTHLDKLTGYLEFARFLKQQNLTFTIPLSSQFETHQLSAHLRAFAEEHLSLILTSVPPGDYKKILQFFKEMPQIFAQVEEFLRALMGRVSFKQSVELDKLCLTSNQEGSSAFSVFQWAQRIEIPLFFRYPLLKHQIAASFLAVAAATFFLSSYVNLRRELSYVKRGVELLDLLQFRSFDDQIVKSAQPIRNTFTHSSLYPHFFTQQLKGAKDHLAHRIRKHILEPAFRKTVLENKGEFKYLYFLGLTQASSNNHMGKFVYKNAGAWSKVLGFDPNLVKLYVTCSTGPMPASLFTESKVSPFLPLTSPDPWVSYLKKMKEITDQPIFIEQPFENEEIFKETEKLLTAISRVRGDPLIFAIATLLDEGEFKENENIKTVHWIGENIDALENFLLFVMHTSIPRQSVQGMNLTQFFAKLKEITLLSNSENELYNFALQGHLFAFDSKKWTDHVIVHNIERAIQEYIAANANQSGTIFFNHTLETPEPSVVHFQKLSPGVGSQLVIPGRYSRVDFEKKVRSPTEKLLAFLESLPINFEEKKRFSHFLTREIIQYIKNYQGKYLSFFSSYDFDVNGLKEAKKLVKELAKPSASFYDFLRTVQQQTNVFSQPILSVNHSEEFNEFTFLDALLQQKEGQAPLLQYQKLMAQLAEDLESAAPASPLLSEMTPAARLSLAIFQNQPNSYAVRLQSCLDQLGIPERFQHSFKKPLLLVYEFGLQDLKQSVESLWDSQFHPKIEALFSKFPFNPEETAVTTLEEIEDALNPQSSFYQELKELALALAAPKETMEEKNACLDPKIHEELSRASYVMNLLWDETGKPKPLILKLRPIPFVTGNRNSVPSLSYIIAGEESVYNFNQDPSWQTLVVEWWKPESSYIGMELLNKVNSTKSYRNLQGPSSAWSFFSLLKQGKREEGNTWKWNLPGKNGKEPLAVSFRFEKDPYELLRGRL